MNSTTKKLRVVLTGDTALELIAPYFQKAGYDVAPQDAAIDAFAPDYIFDVTSHDAVLSAEVPNFYDERMRKLAGCRYSLAGIQSIVDEFQWHVAARRSGGTVKKILAVDADNTLWKGILSEDGQQALIPCQEFQAGLRRLRDAGVLLVLLSKNDSFTLDWFTCCKVNWGPKAGNLIEACKELNLMTDSVVFVDDNPYERAQMSSLLPNVTVAPWFGWPADESSAAAERQLIRRLESYFFSGSGLTDEDRLRAADYATQQSLRPSDYATKDDFLVSLGLWVRSTEAKPSDLDRLVQMAGKTNQFNATTIRRTRAEFEGLLSDARWRIFIFRAGDRFGEQGLVCYVIVDTRAHRISDFVMSCRAMGRTLENFAYDHVAAVLGYCPPIDFVPTAKNAPFAAFLKSLDDPSRTYYKEVNHVTQD